MPSRKEKRPSGHGTHAADVLRGAYDPARHGVHAAALWLAQNPDGHSAHS